MLGKPKLGIVGILPMMLAHMTEQVSVSKVELRCVEVFGHHVAKINLYDLFNPENQTKVWTDKKGSSDLDMSKTYVVEISDADDAREKIIVSISIRRFLLITCAVCPRSFPLCSYLEKPGIFSRTCEFYRFDIPTKDKA